MKHPIEMEMLVGSTRELSRVLSDMRVWMRHRLTAEQSDDVLLAAGEAIANALAHGEPPVVVVMKWSTGTELSVVVRDDGQWGRSTDSTSLGLGLAIMSKLMDDLTVETAGGTTVTLRRRFDGP